MSRIDDLLAELDPGVFRRVELGVALHNFDSKRRPVTRQDRKAGEFPYYGANGIQDYVDDYLFDGVFLLVGEDGSVIQRDGRPVLNWATGKIWVNNHAHVLQSALPELDLRFVYFYLQTLDISAYITGGTQPKLNQRSLNSISIPLPPLEVQLEIVRVLDQFTQLDAELEAELEARRSQYRFYGDGLLGDSLSGGRQVTLAELFDMRAGKFISASEIHPARDTRHPIPCFGGGGLRGYVAEANQSGDAALIGRQGALCGNVKRASGDFYATEHSVVVKPRAGVDISWAYHLLVSMNLNQYASKSAQPGLAVGTLDGLVVRVPSLDSQMRIGSALDKFDALVNDLNIGLPAELSARRKQYEYYRDRLLTFKEAPA